ncbi:hypothetical protein [Ferruginibacter sp.]
MLKISIPQPCHEDWNAMTPNEQGRHCNVCVKTVVDFTSMSDEEVKHFFLHKKEEKVCGRFRGEQLQRIRIELPYNVLTIRMASWKKFLAIMLLVFSSTLFSCDAILEERTQGKTELTGVIAMPAKEAIKDTVAIPATAAPILPPVVCSTDVVGITAPITGAIVETPVPPEPLQPILQEPLPDTSLPKNILGGITINSTDSAAIKNPAKPDSLCDNNIKIFN